MAGNTLTSTASYLEAKTPKKPSLVHRTILLLYSAYYYYLLGNIKLFSGLNYNANSAGKRVTFYQQTLLLALVRETGT